MKANSRRRVLISSMAMLLVAIVALGTATYAWFTSSTTATAGGINVKTIQSSELQISSVNVDWGTKVDYKVANKVLLPTSTYNGLAWYTAEAAAKTAMDAKDDTAAAIESKDNYYIADQINVRNKGVADVKDVKIQFTVPGNYTRVAIVPAKAKGAGQAFVDGTNFHEWVFDNAGEEYYAASGLKNETVGEGEEAKEVTRLDTTKMKAKNTFTVDVGLLKGKQGNAEAGDAKFYNIYVWFEGQDAQCYDNNAGVVVDDIAITVSGTTVDQVTNG